MVLKAINMHICINNLSPKQRTSVIVCNSMDDTQQAVNAIHVAMISYAVSHIFGLIQLKEALVLLLLVLYF